MNGGHTLVDDDDYRRLSRFRWRRTYGGYIESRTGSGPRLVIVSMHRKVMGFPKRPLHVDHANGDKTDNRKSNLRVCSASENVVNSGPRGGSSRFKGVSWNKEKGKWDAQMKWKRKRLYLGRFEEEEDAAIVYNVAAQLIFGEFAYLNKV